MDATHAGLVSGTPAYMSPEQCRGQPVDGRTDVYALGLTAFFLLTGRKPYESQTLGVLLDQQLNHPLPSMRALRESIPEEIEDASCAGCARSGRASGSPTWTTTIHALEACLPRPVPPAPLATRLIAAALDLMLILMVALLVDFGMRHLFGIPDFLASLAGRHLLLGALRGVSPDVGVLVRRHGREVVVRPSRHVEARDATAAATALAPVPACATRGSS